METPSSLPSRNGFHGSGKRGRARASSSSVRSDLIEDADDTHDGASSPDSGSDRGSELEAAFGLGPLDVFSDIDSGEEWHPSDGSDTDDDERVPVAGPSSSNLHASQLPQPNRPRQRGLHFNNIRSETGGGARGLTAAERRRLAQDAKGSDTWRNLSQRRRSKAPATGVGEDEHEVEEAELGRLVAGLGLPSAAQTAAGTADIEDAAMRSDMLAASGFKSQKKRTRRATTQTALSPEVSRLLAEANIAYVNMDLEEAIEKLQEVIRIDPTIKAAWSTLANCFREQKDTEREIQAKSIEAILTPRATDLWISLAHRHADLHHDREAIKCFGRAIATSREKDRGDVLDAMWDKACLLRDLNDHRAALTAFKAILKVRPHNAEVLSQVVPLCLITKKRMEAVDLLEASWQFNREHFPDPRIGEGLRFSSFSGSEIATLCDLLLMSNEPLAALHIVRRGSRWLQGRGAEDFWDDVIDDDREFDETREGMQREGAVGYGRRVEMAPVYQPLDTELRLRLGNARAKMGDLSEAEGHFQLYLDKTDPADCSEQYLEIVDLNMDLGLYEQAHRILLRMTELDFLCVPDVIFKYGLCSQACDDPTEAVSAFEAVLESDPTNLEVKLRLAEAYEASGRVQDARRTINELMAARAALYGPMQQIRLHGVREPIATTTAAAAEADLGLEAEAEAEAESAPSMSLDGGRGSSKAKARKPRHQSRSDERQRVEKAREEEATVFIDRLTRREAEVFVDGWWRSDFVIGISGRDPASEVQQRYGINVGEDDEARVNRFAATRDWLDLSGRLIEGFRNMSQIFPRSRVRKNRTGSGSHLLSRLRSSRHSGAYFKDKRPDVDIGARDLISRLQDRLMHDSVMRTDGDVGSLDRIGGSQATLSQFNEPSSHQASGLANLHVRGMNYDMWTEMFIKHAFVLTKIGAYEAASELLDDVVTSHVATSSETRRMALNLCQAACASHARAFLPAFQALRNNISAWQFNNTPLRLLTSLSNVGGFYSLDAYVNHKLQKLLVRRSRIHEVIANNGKYDYVPATGRYVVREKLQGQPRSLGYSKNREPYQENVRDAVAKKGKRSGRRVMSTDGHRQRGRRRSGRGRASDEDSLENNDNEEDEEHGNGDRDGDVEADDDGEIDDDDETDEGGTNEDAASNTGLADGSFWAGGVVPREKPPTKEDIIGEIAYGCFLLVANSWQSALGIALRTYARLPNDPLVCLMAAVACFGRMTNRQTDNRHHLLIQGLSFLSIYRKVRIANAPATHLASGSATSDTVAGVQSRAWIEAEYNIGRGLHQAGLLTEAMQAYERVLRAHDQRQKALSVKKTWDDNDNDDADVDEYRGSSCREVGFDCYREAAWNLSLIYSINGNGRAARVLLNKYLRIA